jgi:nucleoside phosphorylase/CheY-like chemotaxis protein
MNILIVDDQRDKLKKLLPVLEQSCGLSGSSLHVAYDAMQARQVLGEQYFDLLILDLLLPLRAADEPELKHSTDLLREISFGGTLKKPNFIIGITADGDAGLAARPVFADQLWTIVEVDETSDGWIQRILNCVSYLCSSTHQARDGRNYLLDVAIITALPSEMEAIHKLPWDWGVEEPLDDSAMMRKGTFRSGARTFQAVAACAPRMGMIATAILATKIINVSRPRFLVMAGVCAGIEGKASLGDIIFADPCWDYQSGKYLRDDQGNSRFAISPHQLPVAQFVRVRAESLRRDKAIWRDIQDRWPTATANLNLRIGPLGSGSAVIADADYAEKVKEQQRQILGIEMEAYGVLAAAHSADRPRPTAFVMKSVCDFANAAKSDEIQPYAAYTSAEAIRAFFERHMGEIEAMAGG